MFESMKDAMDTQRKIQTKNELTLEDLHRLLMERVNTQQLGVPELKKGLLGAAISFPKTHRVIPRITVKGNQVKIAKVTDTSKTSVSVGKMSMALDKDLRGKNALDTVSMGNEYFKAVAGAVEAALADQ